MKILICLFVAVLAVAPLYSQDSTASSIPSVKLKNIDGDEVNTNIIGNSDKPVVLSLWATWCKPCLQELQTYHGLYERWQTELGATVVAVSIDDARNAKKVPGFVKGRNWEFLVLMDENQNFKRAMNVNNVPHTFIIHKGKVVWSHAAYASGDEEDLEAELKKLVGK